MSYSYIEHEELYERVLIRPLSEVRISLWIATANLKETLVEPTGPAPRGRRRRRYEPFARRLAELARRGVDVRILHGGRPSERFTQSLRDSHALDEERFAMRRCVRVHFKTVIADGRAAYLGSANLTGAGLGAKSPERRNFEVGLWIEDEPSVARLRDLFSAVWGGAFCPECGRADVCEEPLAEPRP